MKNSIKELLLEADVRTSPDFTQQTMDKLQSRLQRRLRFQLFGLIAGIILFVIALIFTFLRYELAFTVFGLSIALPEVSTLAGFTLISALIILYIYQMIGSIRKASPTNMNVSRPE